MKEQEPNPPIKLTEDQFRLLVAENLSELDEQQSVIEGLINKAQWGEDNGFRVHILLHEESGQVTVHLEEKGLMGYKPKEK